MAAELVQASRDEYGKYTGGAAGDQDGKEVLVRSWYNRPWNIIMRPNHADIGKRIAGVAKILAASPLVGYDQSQRLTLYKECEKIGWDIYRISEMAPCECDCSSLIPVILRFVGIEIPSNCWTGNLASCLKQTGNFAPITDPAVLTSGDRVRTGDILINSAAHAAVCVSSGDDAPVPAWYTAVVTASDYLQIRRAPDISAEVYKIGGHSQRLPHNAWIIICEETKSWARIFNIEGWVNKKHILRG